MSKEVFGEIKLSEAVDRLKSVCDKGMVLMSFPPCNDFRQYDKEFCEAVDTVLNFVDRAVDTFSRVSCLGVYDD